MLVVTGLMLVAGGLALILLAGTDSSWTALMPGLLVGCVGTGLFNPAVVAIALGSVSEEQSGLAAGTNDAFRQGGIAVGVAVFGAVVPAASALGGRLADRLRRWDAHRGDHRRRARGGRSGRLRPPVPRRTFLVGQAPGRGRGSSRIALTGSQRRQVRNAGFEGPPRAGLRASGPNYTDGVADEHGQVKEETTGKRDPEREARRRLALAQIRQYPDPSLRLRAGRDRDRRRRAAQPGRAHVRADGGRERHRSRRNAGRRAPAPVRLPARRGRRTSPSSARS